ncbi:hypothetical protein 2 [Wuhan pillworm virus 3]|uniref:hypothetical protein 2 n=1 Tax=Wuhan pillworm virus 3 TaxID=1923746 RepID=UPI0009099778|nr:hypothetical protein 2 [Wuhan pillworm virus 3]APG75927.1 hypothetical protein 2 [Wuhan pillworm virus 3]
MRDSDPPSKDIAREALFRTLSDFRHLQRDCDPEWYSDENMDRVINSLNRNASPGNPFCWVANNGQLIDKHRELLKTLVRQRLNGASAYPIRLFVKPEWHKKSKIEEGRYRLIWSVSVVDQIIDKMLLGDYLDQEPDNWIFHPSKVGWSYLKGGWKYVPKGVGTDFSAWDMTAQQWLLDLLCEFYINQHRNPTAYWISWVRRRFGELYHGGALVQLSDGTLLEQLFGGIQKSGTLYTLSGNSIMQVILHHVICLSLNYDSVPWLWVLGDDRLQERVDKEYADALKRWVVLKDISYNEFCGMHYGSTIEPAYRSKHLLNLAADPTPERLMSYQLLYRHSKFYPALVRFIRSLNVQPAHEIWVDEVWG